MSAATALKSTLLKSIPFERTTDAESSSTLIYSEAAFYRKYTERLLRRYMRSSMHISRSPSVLGNLTIRGRCTYSGTRSFEDAVIFVHDVETCIKKLDRGGQELLARIALQEHTQHEVAQMHGTSVRSVMRRYLAALDQLTCILMDVHLLDVSG